MATAVLNKRKKTINRSKVKNKSNKKFVYYFGGKQSEAKPGMKALLGGKGANLAEMANLGIPVPPGFTITTEACGLYYENDMNWPGGLSDQITEKIDQLEKMMGAQLGSTEDPLLVSVRSGAAVSMPGMMDTVLNLGINEAVVRALIIKTENERFAWDSYRRFIQMFGNVVMDIEHEEFEHVIEAKKKAVGVHLDTELTAEDLRDIVSKYLEVYGREVGSDFPQDPRMQLDLAINAVFKSWNNPRAHRYRQLNDIRGLKGTAVNVQAMVFGNMGETSGTGVLFSRNPSTGENKLYGEYLMNAQGEDVVAGIRTPKPLHTLKKQNAKVYDQLLKITQRLEKHYRDMQDMEFTIQEGKLYILQTRNGKRTASAAIRIACDLVKEKLITEDQALLRLDPKSLDQLLHPTFDPKAPKDVLSVGLPASPGAATGKIVFDAHTAERWAQERNERVILVRIETSPEDIGGMSAAKGILTARGGMTSHAAVVARGMGKCCVAGCGDLNINYSKKEVEVKGRKFKEGDYISLDGSRGEVYAGEVPTQEPKLSKEFAQVMKWADRRRFLKVRTNADTPHDAIVARKFGAEGIGLCRTEHMFFEGDRIIAVREMILADDRAGREKALKKLLPMQRSDFEGIFVAMKGLAVTIRLLDPPLHEFVPHEKENQKEMAEIMGVSVDKVRQKVSSLSEFNPMLGHRGCRLGISYPEIYDMQVRAIMEAACIVKKKKIKVYPEIMIPLVGTVKELSVLKQNAKRVIQQVFQEQGTKVDYLIGTMIEIPRAALTSAEIAKEAEFFSFGTNDLTQMTFGYSRDDAGVFLTEYLNQGILDYDPFQTLDASGVGELIRIGIESARKVKPKLKVGICGEHGGDPNSVKLCHGLGMNYVSCSPFRVPIARLSAAQAAVASSKKGKRK